MEERAKPNHYEVLQLQPYANPGVVVASYRVLSKLYHPDTARDQADLERFRQLQQAYEILSDPQKRQEYDRELRMRMPGIYSYTGQSQSQYSYNSQPRVEPDPPGPEWATSGPDNTWAYTPPQAEDLEFYRDLYDYGNPTRRRRTLVLIVIYILLMAAGMVCGVLGFITAFSPTGSRGGALLYFAVGIALVVIAQLEAYFS